jgi:hypothetical protein
MLTIKLDVMYKKLFDYFTPAAQVGTCHLYWQLNNLIGMSPITPTPNNHQFQESIRYLGCPRGQ